MLTSTSQPEYIILVDEHDQKIGLEEKIAAHKTAKLHRAFSIFVFNEAGETLLQQRAASKYHGGGLWSNACCSHPRDGETVLEAAHRRLEEELGFDCNLTETFSFIYKADMGNGLTEHEFDHIVEGTFTGAPIPNPNEVQDIRWIPLPGLAKDIATHPDHFTPWLAIALPRILKEKRGSV